ncbi:MAG: hypothetical protein IKQ30_09490 [Bacteroidales bacterium]|nr:hypothetical protein [Bacteroidales bacterium]
MENINTITGEITETAEKVQTRPLTAKEKNRAAQFERLLAASAEARQIRDFMINTAKSAAQALFLESQPLNYFILKFVYAPAEEGTTEFKKFNEWKSEGYTIIKGSKAFPVWSQPTKREKKEQDGETASAPAPTPALMENADGAGEEGSTHGERERFNMCYLFSNLQVTRRDQPASTEEPTETAEAQEAPAEEAAAAFLQPEPMEEPEPIAVF